MRFNLRIYFLVAILSVFYSELEAQVKADNTYKFMNLVSSARQVAIGGRIISVYDDDINFVNWNPATLNEGMNSKLALNYTDYFADVNYGSAAFAFTLDSTSTFYTGVNYINYGDFVLSESGEVDGEFTANELSVNLGYSYKIDSSLSVGAQMKIINSVLYQWNSYGVAFDLGLIYNLPNGKTTIGLVVRNMGLQLKSYNSSGFLSGIGEENIPFENASCHR